MSQNMLFSLGYIMGGVLRGGNRDMLQPCEKPRQKKKKKEKYSGNSCSFYLLEEASFSTGGRELNYNQTWTGTTTLWKNQDVTWTGPVECLVLLTTVQLE